MTHYFFTNFGKNTHFFSFGDNLCFIKKCIPSLHSQRLSEMVRYRSISEKILLPYLHFVILQKLPVLVRERLLFVVLLLLSDIVDYHLLVS